MPTFEQTIDAMVLQTFGFAQKKRPRAPAKLDTLEVSRISRAALDLPKNQRKRFIEKETAAALAEKQAQQREKTRQRQQRYRTRLKSVRQSGDVTLRISIPQRVDWQLSAMANTAAERAALVRQILLDWLEKKQTE